MAEVIVTKEGKKENKIERVIVNPKPYAPENIKMSKSQYIARQREIKEREARIKNAIAEIDGKKETIAVEAPKDEIKQEAPKPRGRPKVIK